MPQMPQLLKLGQRNGWAAPWGSLAAAPQPSLIVSQCGDDSLQLGLSPLVLLQLCV